MTLYLTDNTPAEEVHRAKEAGVRAFKLYPAGATTNSDSGVTDVRKCFGALKAMEETKNATKELWAEQSRVTKEWSTLME